MTSNQKLIISLMNILSKYFYQKRCCAAWFLMCFFSGHVFSTGFHY